MEIQSTVIIDFLREQLSTCGSECGYCNPNLIGWMIAETTYVCVHCAGRLMAKGYRIQDTPYGYIEPIPEYDKAMVCDLCHYRVFKQVCFSMPNA